MKRSRMRQDAAGGPLPYPPQADGSFVCWLLIVMALAAFAPCVLVPEWREYRALRVKEQIERHRLDSLQSVVDDERRLLQAMQSDPAVIARLAQRDLSYKQRGDRAVRISVSTSSRPSEHPFTPEPVLLPPILARAASYLPDYDYDAVFCDDQSRLVIMAMSVALMVVALCLPIWRASPRRADAIR